MSEVAIGCGILVALIASLIGLGGIHQIHEGHVGVYHIGGALLDGVTEPGYHTMIPGLTSYSEVQYTIQTDKVIDIPCGTSGGVMIQFAKIEVVNQLQKDMVWQTVKNYSVNYDKTWIFDKIHHEINQFCSKHTLQEVYIDQFDTLDEELARSLQEDVSNWAPGIKIISIRVTKPKIPAHLLKNYEQLEAEKTKYLIAIEAQKVSSIDAETRQMKEKISAQTAQEVAIINMKQSLLEQENHQKISDLENQLRTNQSKTEADAWFYQQQKMIEANMQMLSKKYLQLQAIHAAVNNTKFYLGKQLPQFFMDGSGVPMPVKEQGRKG